MNKKGGVKMNSTNNEKTLEQTADELVADTKHFIVDTFASMGTLGLEFKDEHGAHKGLNGNISKAEQLYLNAGTKTAYEKIAKLYATGGKQAFDVGYPEITDRAIHRAISIYLYAGNELEAIALLNTYQDRPNISYTLLGNVARHKPLLTEYYCHKTNEAFISAEIFPQFYETIISIGKKLSDDWQKEHSAQVTNPWSDVLPK